MDGPVHLHSFLLHATSLLAQKNMQMQLQYKSCRFFSFFFFNRKLTSGSRHLETTWLLWAASSVMVVIVWESLDLSTTSQSAVMRNIGE